MRASKITITILVLAVAVGAFGQTPQRAKMRRAPTAIQAQEEPVATTRDAQGIWHITGGSMYDVYEAMGYAVATDRLFQMDLYRREARGRLSELFGAELFGNDFLSADMMLRNIMYSDDELTELFNGASEDAQTAIQGYVDGINRRVLELYSDFLVMPFEYWAGSILTYLQLGLGYNILPEPWTVEDIIAWLAYLQREFDPEALETGQLDNYVLFQTLAAVYPTQYLAMFSDLRWINDPSAQTMIPPPAAAKSAMTFARQLPAVHADDFPSLPGVVERIRARLEATEAAVESIGGKVKMGSYAWAVSGTKTASGNPIVYSGPQMGFGFPAIVTEGSIRGGGLEISGMTVPGVPGIIIGRTPHHAWSMQVGHAHTEDWFFDSPLAVSLHRMETIHPAGGEPVTIPIYRTHHGPILDPFPYDPDNPPQAVVSWAYAHWGREANTIDAFLRLARATSIAEFDAGIEEAAVSQHFTYADRDGNIAYWMSGWDPIRAPGVDPRFPQIGDGTQEWTGARRPRVHDENTAQGFYGGWNNKASVDYNNAPNSAYYGPAHRAHVIQEYLSAHDDLTYEEIRDLALNIATTDGLLGGGNTWTFVKDDFKAMVAANSTPDRDAAIAMLDAWDGHFVAGGPSAWRFGDLRSDAWALQNWWIEEVLRITFEDEFRVAGMSWENQSKNILFNVLLHALAGQTYYDWFQDAAGTGDKPVGAEAIIIRALDNVIEHVGLGPYDLPRGVINFGHPLLGQLDPAFSAIHSIPYSDRSTYAHCVEYGENGPVRIESMFPLGPSGAMYYNGTLTPLFDPYCFSMAPAYDPFMPRPFPLFE
jgi:penicillin amidase